MKSSNLNKFKNSRKVGGMNTSKCIHEWKQLRRVGNIITAKCKKCNEIKEVDVGKHRNILHYTKQTPEHLKKVYNSLPLPYAMMYSNISFSVKSTSKEFIELYKTKFNESEKIKVLDVGCANGSITTDIKNTSKISLENIEFHGLDYSQELLNQVPDNLFKEKKKINLMNSELDQIPDNTYDIMYSSGVFLKSHVDWTALPGLYRILKPNGYFMFFIKDNFYTGNHREEWDRCIYKRDYFITKKMIDYAGKNVKSPFFIVKKIKKNQNINSKIGETRSLQNKMEKFTKMIDRTKNLQEKNRILSFGRGGRRTQKKSRRN